MSLLQDAQEKFGGVYVARIVESDGTSAYYDSLSLEVEVSSGTIAFSVFIEGKEFEGGSTYEDCYLILKDQLEITGIRVYETYGDWESKLCPEN